MTAQGGLVPIEHQETPIITPQGEKLGTAVVFRDISERREAEEALLRANRHKDQFLAMLGHELRNPLAPIRNAISILAAVDSQVAEIRWCQEVLDRQTRQLTRLVDDLLDVSRVSRGKIRLQLQRVDLREIIRQAVEACALYMQSKSHQLELVLPEEPIEVQGDPARLSQIVSNLLNNAAKYTDSGGRIRLSLETCPLHAGQSLIRVVDNGRGIDAQSIELLFDLFFQVDHNLDRAEGGLGIGLSLVRSLVELHQGSVVAWSAGLGQGSEFQVRLPRLSAPLKSESIGNLVGESFETLAPLRVLVVDDNRDSALSLKLLLDSWGCSASVAFDGNEALQSIEQRHPDVLLLDIGLPHFNGYELCREARRRWLPHQLIIAMTGYGQEEDRKRGLESGFDHYLVKPVDHLQLNQRLSHYRRMVTANSSHVRAADTESSASVS